MRDPHGQPPARFRATAVAERSVDELIGLCRGLLADRLSYQEDVAMLGRYPVPADIMGALANARSTHDTQLLEIFGASDSRLE